MSIAIIVLSWIGTVLTAVMWLPQCYKILKHKDTKAISLIMVIIILSSAIIWIIFAGLNIAVSKEPKNFYGIFIANILLLISAIFIISFKIYNIKYKKEKY